MNRKIIILVLTTTLLISCSPTGVTSTMTVIPPTATSIPVPTQGDMRTDAKGIEQVWVPAGSFKMGTDQAAVDALTALNPPSFVAGAMAACPDDVPWQRIINSQGKISERAGAERQRQLLEEEGIVFVRDKIDLKKYGWKGLGESDEPRQETLF